MGIIYTHKRHRYEAVMAFDRSNVKGLPSGSSIQIIKGKPYVYFKYTWKDSAGKIRYARDYLGVVEDDQFVPNDYYLRVCPTKEHRPAERWSAKDRKETAIHSLQPEEAKPNKALSEEEVQTKSVGVTSLAAAILRENGFVDDVIATFNGDKKTAQQVLNIALGAAITAKPTYLSADESAVQMFFGNDKCLSSPRASELHKTIGSGLDLSMRISKRRIARLPPHALLALDGTRINSNSDNILDSVVGKAKNGLFAQQINHSLLVDAVNGAPVAYRYYSGSTNDVSTLEDFTRIWDEYDLREKEPMLVFDRGYYQIEAFVKLGKAGYRFLVGAKTNFKLVRSIIEDQNSEFYDVSTLMENADLYGLQQMREMVSQSGRIDVRVNVFRNPVEEMAQSRHFLKQLQAIETNWLKGKVDKDEPLLEFFETPIYGKPLVRNQSRITEECYLLGFFAFVTNADLDLQQSLDIYQLRNEAEVVFKLMLSNLMHSTRVHSSQALDGRLFTSFVALGVLTDLRHRMKADLNGSPVFASYTIAEVFARLKKIQLVTLAGKSHLINVSHKDKALIAALGFEGLFDTVENVTAPLAAL